MPELTSVLPAATPLPAASDPAFERFVRLVRRQLGVPVALVSLVDAHGQVFPGAAGLPEPWQTSRRTPLTHSFCQSDRLAIAARYLPAHARDAVGGDWYDAFSTPDGAMVVVVGDTSGHDIGAAADMGQLRTLLRGYAVDREELPSATMRRLDRAMATLSVDTLATVVLGRIEQDAAGAYALCWTNAGHPPPLLLHPDGQVTELGGRAELLVGVHPGAARSDHRVALPAGSTLVLFTDGLIEQRAGDRDIDSGTAQVVGALTGQGGLPLEALLNRVLERLAEPRDDDVVVLAVRIG